MTNVVRPWLNSQWGFALARVQGVEWKVIWHLKKRKRRRRRRRSTDLDLSLKNWRIPDLHYCRWPNSRSYDRYCWHIENWRIKFLCGFSRRLRSPSSVNIVIHYVKSYRVITRNIKYMKVCTGNRRPMSVSYNHCGFYSLSLDNWIITDA